MAVPSEPPPPSHRDDFEIAVICALSFEAEAVESLFDHSWKVLSFKKARGDLNTYKKGMIGEHNVVLVILPGIGKSSAASVASSCRSSFPRIRLAIVVGVCGGVPIIKKSGKEILLGDVLISEGLVPYDFGRQFPDGFSRKDTQADSLPRPNNEIRSFLANLKTQKGYDNLADRTSAHLKRLAREPGSDAKYPGAENDKLFEATYRHKHHASFCTVCYKCEGKLDEVCEESLTATCDELRCNNNFLVPRKRLEKRKEAASIENKDGIKVASKEISRPEIHFGWFASGDTVMKSGEDRDEIAVKENVIGFEMEGAGVWENLPCVVIKAVCDYSDSHKNKRWQKYAAAAAASCTKAFLQEWSVADKPTPHLGESSMATGNSNKPILPSSDSAASVDMSNEPWSHEPQCLPGTQLDLLQEIMTWSQNPNGASIFWLNAMEGTGKSTIARTVASRLAGQKLLGAALFFSRNHGERGNATRFLTDLATQLANRIPTIRPSIHKATSENFNVSMQNAHEQWENLVLQPLSNIKGPWSQSEPQIFVVVVDALDECDSREDVQLILQLLVEAKSLNNIRLRFLVTSRPNCINLWDISNIEPQDFILGNISEPAMQHGMSLYLSHELGAIKRERVITESWPGDQLIELLCQKNKWSFIHALTACRFIGDPNRDPKDGLFLLKRDYVSQSPTSNLNLIYRQIVTDSILSRGSTTQDKDRLIKQFGPIVGSVVTLFDPLSTSTLARLLGEHVEIILPILRSLHSVLSVPGNQDLPNRLLHHSFAEFLFGQQKCFDLDPRLCIDENRAHESNAWSCLRLMSSELKRDIAQLGSPSTLGQEVTKSLVEKSIPPHLQYACRYWIDHFIRSNLSISDHGVIHEFFQEHFLHWLEALSLMGKISAPLVRSLETLESMTVPLHSHEISSLIRDAKSFILCNGSIIEKAPLQVYGGALLFAPKSSPIRRLFSDQGNEGIYAVLASDEVCSPLKMFENRTAMVTHVAFSPDKKQLASVSANGTLRFWDTKTGKLQEEVHENSERINSIAYSSNGRQLASASSDHTVRLWDATTRSLQGTLVGHTSAINSVIFSPTGRLLASASNDHTIRLWNTETATIRKVFKGHTAGVTSVAISPDGQNLASASTDRTVRLWTIEGTPQMTLSFGSTKLVNSLAFSPDGYRLATASRGRIVRIWDLQTGAILGSFMCHSAGIESVIAPHKEKQWLHKNSARVPKLNRETSARSAPPGPGSGRHERQDSNSFQPEVAGKSSSQATQYSWGPGNSNGTSRDYRKAAPLGYISPQDSDRGARRRSQILDNLSNRVLLQDARAPHQESTPWRPHPKGGNPPWRKSTESSPPVEQSKSDVRPKTYGWGRGRGHQTAPSASRISLESSNDQAPATQIALPASGTPREYSDGQIEINNLSFSSDGTHLITDIGIVKLENATSGVVPNKAWPSYALDVESSWITLKGEKIILLPAEYRPVCQDFRNGAIALGSASGRVTILRVDPDSDLQEV